MANKEHPVTPQSQSDKFKDLARELETNDDEAAFDRALKKVAKVVAPKKEAAKQSE